LLGIQYIKTHPAGWDACDLYSGYRQTHLFPDTLPGTAKDWFNPWRADDETPIGDQVDD
jgi:hypothetical protein